jgi:hypothetical protein
MIRNSWRLPLALVALAMALAWVVLDSAQLLDNAQAVLMVSVLVLITLISLWTRRQGYLSPVPIVASALLIYFPFRGLLLLSVPVTSEHGINVRVISALRSQAAVDASLVVLIGVLAIAIAAELVWYVQPRRRAESLPNPGALLGLLGIWGLPLMGMGLACLAIQIPQQFSFLQGDPTSSGLVAQLVQLGSFCFGLGLILERWATAHHRRLVGAAVGIALLICLFQASKDSVVLVLVALLVRTAVTKKPGRASPARIVAAGGVAITLVFVVFPAITTYRRSIQSGATVAQAGLALPNDLLTKSLILGTARPADANYFTDSLLYLTNRLHGFDSILLVTELPRNQDVLQGRSLILAPLGTVLQKKVWSPDIADVGLYFGQVYWGSVAGDNTHIAITLFGQADLAQGLAGVVLVGSLVGLCIGLAARTFLSSQPISRCTSYALFVAGLAFERDLLVVVVPLERRLALLLVVGLAAAVAVKRRRELGPTLLHLQKLGGRPAWSTEGETT